MSNQPSPEQIAEQRKLFGHPTGLYMLFFAEMWERFSYYGMRALLVLYILKGFLSRTDGEAYAIYGAYTSLVYATPFIGGMIADKLLGARRAVILGGLLMAAGHLVMTIEVEAPFFIALALLIVGNGFFKPNISTIVGSLYPEGSPQRDAGFTIFYIGINLGAAMAPLLCGYVGENYGWHYGFGLATIGMLIGLAVFVAPPDITRVLILAAAVLSGGMMIWLNRDEVIYALGPNALVALCLMIAGVVAFIAISKAGLPSWAGEAPSIEKLKRPVAGPITAEWAVYIGSFVIVPLIALMVSQDKIAGWALIIGGAAALFHLISATLKSPKIERERLQVVLILMFFTMLFWAFFEQAGSSINLFTDRNVNRVFPTSAITEEQVGSTVEVAVTQGLTGYMLSERKITQDQVDSWDKNEVETLRWTVSHDNVGMNVVTETRFTKDQIDQTIEIAISKGLVGHTMGEKVVTEEDLEKWESENLATINWPVSDDDVDMDISLPEVLDEDRIGKTIEITVSPELAGRTMGSRLITMADIDFWRKYKVQSLQWPTSKEHVGMPISGSEVATSQYQAANPMFIMLFGLVFSSLWVFMGKRNCEPSTPVKFALGIFQLGLAFAALWYAAVNPDPRGMVNMGWLLLSYLLITTGELCLSPVGLSMVTKLAPKSIVSMVMGAWFLATAFSNYLAALIAMFTGVEHGDETGALPPPTETAEIYAGVFGPIAVAAIVSAVIVLLISPKLTQWMHENEEEGTTGEAASSSGG